MNHIPVFGWKEQIAHNHADANAIEHLLSLLIFQGRFVMDHLIASYSLVLYLVILSRGCHFSIFYHLINMKIVLARFFSSCMVLLSLYQLFWGVYKRNHKQKNHTNINFFWSRSDIVCERSYEIQVWAFLMQFLLFQSPTTSILVCCKKQTRKRQHIRAIPKFS